MFKKIGKVVIIIFIFIFMMPSVISSNTGGYVEVQIAINDEFAKSGRDAALRLEVAKAEFEGKQFTTLQEASNIVKKLYSREENGNYTSTPGVNPVHTDGNPLYYRASDRPTDAEKKALLAITFIIHGTIFSGNTTDINLSAGGDGYFVSDIQVLGKDNAVINDCSGITASVAGGYAENFVDRGTLAVKGVEFTKTSGNTHIAASGSSYAPSSKTAIDCNMVIEDCTFKNMLYTYVYDADTQNQNITIQDCIFNEENSGSYAIFIQPDAVTANQGGKIVLANNTISGYKRGINMEARANADVEIKNNTIKNISDVGGSAIQITRCKNISVENNNISNIKYNVVRVHSLATAVQSVKIKNNVITDCGYMIFVEKNSTGDFVLSGENIIFQKNSISNVDIFHGYDKDAPEGSKESAHNTADIIFGDLYIMDITFIDSDGKILRNQSVRYNEKIIVPQTPIKKGFKFESWLDLNGNLFDFNSNITRDVTLQAKWIKVADDSKPPTGVETDGYTKSEILYSLLSLSILTIATLVFKRRYLL